MNKIKFSIVSFLATLALASSAYATDCTTDADCAVGEVCTAVASAECPPCAEGSACDACATELFACVATEAPVACEPAAAGSGSGATEGSAAVDCGSGEVTDAGSGVAEVDAVAGSGSGTDAAVDTAPPWGDGSGAAGAADKSKEESGCSTVPTAAGIFGIFAMIGTLLFLRRRNITTK